MSRLKRKIDKYLIDWKNSKDKMPLIVKGARQIGKTESIENFAKNNYKNIVEINFALDKKYFDIFDQNIIISSDEEVYGNIYRRENLKEKGFDIINIDYAKDPKVLIDIIDARIKLHNQSCSNEYKLKLLEQMLDEDVIKKIAVLSNGNIRKILCTAKLAYSKCNRESENKSAVGKYILNTLDRSKNITGFMLVKTLYL